MHESTSVVIVDDHLVLRDSLAGLLVQQADVEVVGLAATFAEGLAVIRRQRPAVALIDIALPDGDGVGLIEQVHEERGSTRCLALTGSESLAELNRVLAAGGGFVSKTAPPDQLLDAIREAAKGRTPVVAAFERESARTPELTPREREVLKLIAEGCTSKEAAAHLGVSPATVDTHRHRLSKKLGLRHRWQLVRYAIDHGILR